ncbi:MAG: tetratricopeptide repeat protein, partial [Candidatus Omnitrophica bacterium]|nr:tetratricopeptide repeat protein [Candidatus Omnitrophota bacterium]
MRIKYFFFITIIMVAGAAEPAGAGAAQSETLFYEGNALYQEGRYREAAARYEQIREQGEENGSLYFNLGNVYFRQGAYGKAMLNYERSRHFIPHDSDLKANQAYLSERLNLPSRQLPGAVMGRMNERVWAPFSLNGRTVALSVLYILG